MTDNLPMNRKICLRVGHVTYLMYNVNCELMLKEKAYLCFNCSGIRRQKRDVLVAFPMPWMRFGSQDKKSQQHHNKPERLHL